MYTYALLAAAALSGGALAAPSQERASSVSMMADVTAWTITGLSRACDTADTTCTWTFGINNGTGITPCTEVVTGSPASQTNGGPATCGVGQPYPDLPYSRLRTCTDRKSFQVYTVTSGWSGQFGPGNGFVRPPTPGRSMFYVHS